jgi:hypothetical protein
MKINFRPGKLGAKPDALTRRWDVYPKDGGGDYASVNPENFRPMFAPEQLAPSPKQTTLRAINLIDAETLRTDILHALQSDTIAQKELASITSTGTGSSDKWKKLENGFLTFEDRIYVPDAGTLRTRVLQEKHDHPLSGHFGQRKTLKLVRHEYMWPRMRETVEKFVESCVPCGHSKSRCHRPYGTLQQLPIPERPWHSVSMDFIEQLPESQGHTAILVIVDRFMKQALFIPTQTTPPPPMSEICISDMCSQRWEYPRTSPQTKDPSSSPISSAHSGQC